MSPDPRPDWSAIERDIECALIAEKTQHDLRLLGGLVNLAVARGRFDIECAELAKTADNAAAAFIALAAAWNAGPAWN